MNGPYGGSYSDQLLRSRIDRWAGLIEDWMGRLRKVFVHFNNDIGGHAVRNARYLRAMLTGKRELDSSPTGRAA